MYREEHPFPQMERSNWTNLNGVWEFEFDFGNSGIDRELYNTSSFSKTINVPFCPESKLSGIHYTDFIPAVWYKRDIYINQDLSSTNVILHFGAIDYESIIYINHKEVYTHKGGYSSFSINITSSIKSGANSIIVYAKDDPRSGLQPRGKQSCNYYSNGCDYTRTTGIWQTVWLEYVPKSYIENVWYYPNIAEKTLTIKAVFNNDLQKTHSFSATAFFNNNKVGENIIKVEQDTAFITLALSELHLWSIGEGNLYNLILKYDDDLVTSYFGMREITICGNEFRINGNKIFQKLVLDQGFYADGIYTAPSEKNLIDDIELSLKMGFNGARLHQKIFEPRFLYACDKLGYIVWGEHANWGLDLSNPLALHSFIPEWTEALNRDFNHPSIIGWCPLNETWDFNGRKQLDSTVKIIYELTKTIDTTRPCIDTSGNFHVITDIYDIHDYEQNPQILALHYEPLKNNELPYEPHPQRQQYDGIKPYFVSEFGGIKWNSNSIDKNGWGYGEAPKTLDEYISRFKSMLEVLEANPNICGYCYTQLYDIEQEINGLYNYNREPKFSI